MIGAAALIALYMAPTIVASLRRVEAIPAIIIVNVALGWTFVGWVVALAWASIGKQKPLVVYAPPVPGQPLVARWDKR